MRPRTGPLTKIWQLTDCSVSSVSAHAGSSSPASLPRALASGTAHCLAAAFTPRGHPQGVTRVENFFGMVRLVTGESCLGICERLFVPQRYHGIDPHRTLSRDVAGDQSDRSKKKRCHAKCDGVSGAHTVEQ
jgi:hypothetical protein